MVQLNHSTHRDNYLLKQGHPWCPFLDDGTKPGSGLQGKDKGRKKQTAAQAAEGVTGTFIYLLGEEKKEEKKKRKLVEPS